MQISFFIFTFTPHNKHIAVMKTLNQLNLTELETSFINTLIPLLYSEKDFTDTDIKEISSKMGITIESGKGVLGSLVKKGIVNAIEFQHSKMVQVGRKIKMVIVDIPLVVLNEDYYYLHPTWSKN